MKQIVYLTSVLIIFSACGGGKTYTPKPRGYFRIEVPEHAYQKYDTVCPFYFEYAHLAQIKPYSGQGTQQPCWFDIHYPQFRATLHCSYETVNNNLKKYIDDAQTLVFKHVIKASGIEEATIVDSEYKVYGTVYQLQGDPATPYQFYLTDSTRHFFRAALYFDYKPNYDSLRPILDFLKQDVDHMIETFQWK
jgi:gliding motility-associated lipoprotein GldD